MVTSYCVLRLLMRNYRGRWQEVFEPLSRVQMEFWLTKIYLDFFKNINFTTLFNEQDWFPFSSLSLGPIVEIVCVYNNIPVKVSDHSIFRRRCSVLFLFPFSFKLQRTAGYYVWHPLWIDKNQMHCDLGNWVWRTLSYRPEDMVFRNRTSVQQRIHIINNRFNCWVSVWGGGGSLSWQVGFPSSASSASTQPPYPQQYE